MKNFKPILQPQSLICNLQSVICNPHPHPHPQPKSLIFNLQSLIFHPHLHPQPKSLIFNLQSLIFNPQPQPQPQPHPKSLIFNLQSLIFIPQPHLQFVVLILTFLIFSQSSWAADLNRDSLKTRYKISDPRNPDCPCHAYQLKADKEYIQMLSKLAENKKSGLWKAQSRQQPLVITNSKRNPFKFRTFISKKKPAYNKKRATAKGHNWRRYFRKDIVACHTW